MKHNWLLLTLWIFITTTANAEQTLLAPKIKHPPQIDGKGKDQAWSQAIPITTHDPIANIPLELQAVHDGNHLYIKVRFPDRSENRTHKSLIWNKKSKLYLVGPKREDTFIFKWSMQSTPTDISLSANSNYKADIWYWKAFRTDHAGYADDKYQIYSNTAVKKAQRLLGGNGQTFYLTRRGDAGQAAYKGRIVVDYSGDEITGMTQRQPQGSRADVKAKGRWKDGFWTIEFARALDTQQMDDAVIPSDTPIQFGVSRYEIAGRLPNAAQDEPLFGSGEVGERLLLQLQ